MGERASARRVTLLLAAVGAAKCAATSELEPRRVRMSHAPALALFPVSLSRHTVSHDCVTAFIAQCAALGTHRSVSRLRSTDTAHTLALFGCHSLADCGVSDSFLFWP